MIDEKATPDEHDNLLAVTQVLTGLRYNDPGLLALLGGKEAMIESPVLKELLAERLAERSHKLILRVLKDRFGAVPGDVITALTAVPEEDRLESLNAFAAQCPDVQAFRQRFVS